MFTKALRRSNAKWVEGNIRRTLPRLGYLALPSPSSVPPVIIYSQRLEFCAHQTEGRRGVSSPTCLSLSLFTWTPSNSQGIGLVTTVNQPCLAFPPPPLGVFGEVLPTFPPNLPFHPPPPIPSWTSYLIPPRYPPSIRAFNHSYALALKMGNFYEIGEEEDDDYDDDEGKRRMKRLKKIAGNKRVLLLPSLQQL
nr:hypothetical transcript [Hymenolepis microstoma]